MSKAASRNVEVPKRIHVLGSGRHEEGVAGGAVIPGEVVSLATTNKYVRHATAGAYCEKTFAIEDALQGRPISTAYALDERLSFVVASPGDVVFGWLKGAENATRGALLASAGDGTLRVKQAADIAIAIAMDPLNLTALPAARLKVRIL
jgi:hypothetical protein